MIVVYIAVRNVVAVGKIAKIDANIIVVKIAVCDVVVSKLLGVDTIFIVVESAV